MPPSSFRSGVDIKTAQTRLGHSDPRLTLAIYVQATTEGDRSAAEKLGNEFMAPKDSGGHRRTGSGA
jgi:integrase